MASKRQEVMKLLNTKWSRYSAKLQKWAQNPLHAQKNLLGKSDTSKDGEAEDEMLTRAVGGYEGGRGLYHPWPQNEIFLLQKSSVVGSSFRRNMEIWRQGGAVLLV